MAGHEDTFFAVGADEDVAALAGDLRPAFVFDRSGTRLLWSNAAGLASLGGDPKALLLRHFPSSSPLARRISVVAGQLVSGQTRTDRIPLPRGLVPAPVLCRVTRIASGDHRGILVIDVETKPVFATPDIARAAYEAVLQRLRPDEEPEPDFEADDAETARPVVDEAVAAVPPAEITASSPEPEADAPEILASEPDLGRDEPPVWESDATTDAEREGRGVADDVEPDVADDDLTAVATDPELDGNDLGPSDENPIVAEAESGSAWLPADPAGQRSWDMDHPTTDAGSGPDAGEGMVAETEIPEPITEDIEAPGEPVVEEPEQTDSAAASEPIVAEPEQADSEARPAFNFPSHGRNVRFVFELADDLAIAFLSPELAETVGPEMAPAAGESWPDLSRRLDFDPNGRLLSALGRHDTFTGLTVDWPVQDLAVRVPVDLAGMPVFSRERRFMGYRGFGIAKTGAAFAVAVEPEEPSSAGILPFTLQAEPNDHDEPVIVEDAALASGSSIDRSSEFDQDMPEGDFVADSEETAPYPDEEETDPAFAEVLPTDGVDEPDVVEDLQEETIGAEEAPALVVDVETEVVIEPPLPADQDIDEDRAYAPDAETLSTAEAQLYAAPEDVPSEDLDVSDEIAFEPTPEDADGFASTDAEDWQDDLAEATPSDDGALSEPDEEASFDRAFSATSEPDFEESAIAVDLDEYAVEDVGPEMADDQPTDDGLAILPDDEEDEAPDFAAFEMPDLPEETDDAEAESDDAEFEADATVQNLPAEAQAAAVADLDWEERRGEVIPSPMVARPIPPQADLSPEEAARRQLSRPEREAFEKIAEALGARVEENAFRPRSSEHDVIRVVAASPKTAAEPMVPIDSAVLDRLPVAMAILRDGDVVLVNRAFLDLSGHASLQDLEADGGFAEAFVGSPVARQGVLPAIRHRDGGIIPVEAKLHSVNYGGGMASLIVVQPTNWEPVPLVMTQTAGFGSGTQDGDIRTRELEAILDTATDGVLVIDEKGTIVGANRSAEALFGSETEAMLGAPLVDLLAPESHRAALDYLDGLARNGVASVLNDGREVIGRVQQGGLVPLFMTMGRVSSSRFCAVLRDITQWKRAEEELTTAKRSAENASSQKSDFLAKISHEIRTPLNAIIGFSEVMMEERFGPVGSERYKEYLRDIHQSGALIMSLVNDLLDLSKIEAGKLDLSFESVVLNDVVRDCVALMQPQANRERVIIRTSLSSSVPNVVADPRSLRQIVLNLLSNAIKFNSAGGQVIVSTIYEDTGEVIIRVRDTGPGMSTDDVERALEPFRQLHTSRPVRGTGLGLPLTKALVEANRAAFRIDSSVGQGTLVQITFPTTRVLAE